jgi:arabinoxylan arabinofuranohydrolase
MSKIRCICCAILLATTLLVQKNSAKASSNPGANVQDEKYSAYLFVYFTGNGKGEEEIRFALSNDGYNYRALNGNKPVLSSSQISSAGGVRDPHILRCVDGKTFFMVATDMVSAKGWNSNRAMVLLKSTNLTDWQSSVVNIPNTFPEFSAVDRVWAPQTIYDSQAKKYMVYWSMHFPNNPDKIYYAYANADFTALETTPKQLFFSPTNNACIDGDIIYFNNKYHLFFKTEDQKPGIKKAVSDKLTEGYVLSNDNYLQQTTEAVEGAGVFKLNKGNSWILMYDMYMKGAYQFTKSENLEDFKVVDNEVTMNFHPRHGTVMQITAKEAERLVSKWLLPEDVLLSAHSNALKKLNISFDSAGKKLYLPIKKGTDLKSFNPEFTIFPGATVTPLAADFTKGPVKYTVKIAGKEAQTFQVIIKTDHNPVLDGYYADPEILYAEKTGMFYIYPTSDGFNSWSGNYFKTFSSKNLVDWKDEGIILQLGKDVSWANRNAWAPCIVEKKIDGQFKYFYYFSAAQKIGVAVADNPTGPFLDSGKPLVDKHPEGVTDGQQIDPDVFTDPKTNKSYLYWGNGYLAGAGLSNDMTSLKTETTKIMTPDATFREGTYVFYREGVYYFMWSEGDTRSQDYRVRYGTSDSPLGKISIPENNIVIAKDKETGIFGTGHNSILQIPGKDEWYIVYHRFNFPNGINMGDAAGFNREVCIDKLEFNKDGSIKQVRPTHQGINEVILNK